MSNHSTSNTFSLNGWILLDKEPGLTSAKALYIFKSILKKILKGKSIPKLGHGGTLDPLASGLLPIALGEATKTVDYVMNKPKTYIFTICFGIATKSYDLDSEVIECSDFFPSKSAINNVLKQFIGSITQVPPIYSAVKVSGKRAYKYARSGEKVQLSARNVNIYTIKLLSYKKYLKSATFFATVGKGTYIRSLAIDIAKKLKAIGVVSYLRRIAIGDFKEKALHLSHLFYNNNISLMGYLFNIEQTLDDIPVINFSTSEAKAVFNGNTKFLSGRFFNSFVDNVYQGKLNSKTFSLLKVTNGKAKILRNFNLFTVGE